MLGKETNHDLSVSYLKSKTMNYPLAGLIIIVVIAGIFLLIKRNQKDKKAFEKQLDNTEIHPGTDDEPTTKLD